MFDNGWDAGLDDPQLAAATHGDAPLIILAGAGTGKTRTLTARVASLIDRGVPPERILLLTFTRRAADDMLSRAAAMCTQPEAARRLQGGTFHAVAHQLVSRHTESLGLPAEMSVLDRADSVDAMDLLRHDHGLAGQDSRMPNPSALIDLYSRAVSTGTPARKLIATDFPWLETHTDAIVGLFRAYTTRKRERGLLDFDDLLLAWRSLLDDPVLGPELAGRYDHVLVDEYQDVNQTQVDIVLGLRPTGRGLTVVGDDAQAIYAFRGSDSNHLINLGAAFDDPTIISLERNFRSRQRLLDLANAVRPVAAGHRLQLHSRRDGGHRARLVRCHDAPAEARAIAEAVLAHAADGRRLRDQAVLMRTGHHSDLLEVELTARQIPYVKFGGLKFLEAAHVKDLVATLRVASNRVDEVAWYRLLRLHDGIGPARARELLPIVAAADLSGDWVADAVAAAPAMSRVSLASTLDGIGQARGRGRVADRAATCLAALRPLVVARYADSVARLGDLDRLVAAAALAPDLAAFVAELTLDPPASTSDLAGPPHLDDDYLVLSTVHSAKGLEWPIVHVMHLVDGAFPSDMALTSNDGLLEEQRLFYVAVTRAADELALYAPLRMPHHRFGRDDKHSFAQISRFIDDDAMKVMDVLDLVPVREVAAVAPRSARVRMPELDDLWA
ncbi:DNA helicase-2 / ATP-dependent DNA helicase PcrA [Nakamurella panacisegetis]|uniref:DNA 3'-5' helicase n=1 Tax=Nakamurella panacisegetis TaxID=1090615 RepID=A0A1H0KZF8_9ACTN|nr:ATP-dependent helicase [Nakamurella panacisegetis]SDO61141.1 DNA helicase-2 / ATP-dependent DNA helicase PcrA [Nakamurella panacisegetis]